MLRGPAERFDAFAACDAALAASGTVALELAMARLPTVVAYRVNTLTHWLVRHLVKIDYAHLLNLILKREAVPELIQGDCTPQRLADARRPSARRQRGARGAIGRVPRGLEGHRLWRSFARGARRRDVLAFIGAKAKIR